MLGQYPLFDHKEDEISGKKKWTRAETQTDTKFEFHPVFFFPDCLQSITDVALCTATTNILEPRAFIPQFQHFIYHNLIKFHYFTDHSVGGWKKGWRMKEASNGGHFMEISIRVWEWLWFLYIHYYKMEKVINRVFFFIFFILKFLRKLAKLVKFQQERKKFQFLCLKLAKIRQKKEHWLQSPLDSSW